MQGQCFDLVTLFLSSAPVNILSDLAILILPLPIITGLRIEKQAKIGLVLTFLCGAFVAIVDVVRIAYLQQALRVQISMQRGDTVSAKTGPPNFYWYTSYGVLWSAIECSVRVMCCCALVMKPLIQRIRPRSLSRSSQSRSRQIGSGPLLSRGSAQGGSGGAHQDDSYISEPGVKSPRNQPLQAILEVDAGVPDEDQMDIMQFFANGPPDTHHHHHHRSPPASPSKRFSVRLPSIPTLGGMGGTTSSSAETQTTSGDQSEGDPPVPVSPKANVFGVPLAKPDSRVSEVQASLMAMPLRWITNNSAVVPPEHIQQPTNNFFDFVQMGGRKPLTELTAKEAWWPILFVSILFFLWGFSYGLLGVLNDKILQVIGKSDSRAIALQNSYWLGYIIGPLTFGVYVLPRYGFKVTFMTGLVIYGCGAMAFWPSSVLVSYGGFFFSNICIAIGLSVLETAANPFIAIAGPGHLSEARLNFSQGIQAVGSIFSPILATKVLFNHLNDRGSLFDVQWCYLAVSLFVLLLALVFFYVPLSEATDEELQQQTDERLANANVSPSARAYGMPARWFVIGAGCFVMSCYVGQQESIAYWWHDLIQLMRPNTDESWDRFIGHCLFAASRFIASGVCYMGFTPRLILNVCCAATFITSLLAMLLKPGKGSFACLLLAMFFEGPVFPTLFATALRDQGRWTKMASIALTASIGFTVVWESINYGIWRGAGKDVRRTLILVVVLCGVQSIYPAMLALSPTLRRWVDPRWSISRAPRAGSQPAPASPPDSGESVMEKTPSSPPSPAKKPLQPMPSPGNGEPSDADLAGLGVVGALEFKI